MDAGIKLSAKLLKMIFLLHSIIRLNLMALYSGFCKLFFFLSVSQCLLHLTANDFLNANSAKVVTKITFQCMVRCQPGRLWIQANKCGHQSTLDISGHILRFTCTNNPPSSMWIKIEEWKTVPFYLFIFSKSYPNNSYKINITEPFSFSPRSLRH